MSGRNDYKTIFKCAFDTCIIKNLPNLLKQRPDHPFRSLLLVKLEVETPRNGIL